MATTKKKAPIREAIILKQRYEGRCGGIMKYVDCDINVGVFDSMEALHKFWTKNFHEPFCLHNPFDPECRRDGFYLERLPLASAESDMKEMLGYIHPAREWRREFGTEDLI